MIGSIVERIHHTRFDFCLVHSQCADISNAYGENMDIHIYDKYMSYNIFK